MCKVIVNATQEETKKTTPSPNAEIFVMDNIIWSNQEINTNLEQLQSLWNLEKSRKNNSSPGEDIIYKDIQISPIRNLNSSFEKVEDNNGNFSRLDYDYGSSGFQDEEDELGLVAIEGISRRRSLETSLSLQTKAKVGEKKKRGPKSNKFKLELAGNAVGQRKLRSGKGYAFSRE